MIYQLSDTGRRLTYGEWKKAGGCSPPGRTMAYGTLGPIAHWDIDKLTLGDIEDACPYTGRDFARFAVEHLRKPSLAMPYKSLLGKGEAE